MNKHLRTIVTLLFTLTFAFSANLSVFAHSISEERVDSQLISQETIIPMSGTETLYRGSGSIGTFTLVGSNLTPVKTMGASGSFVLSGTATANESYFCIRVQIRDYYTGRVLCSTTTGDVSTSNGNGVASYRTPVINVTDGQKIQIYMDYSTTPSRSAFVSMDYTLY